MDFIWTIALLIIGYFGYNWYTGLQEQVRSGRKPDDQVEGPPDPRPEGTPTAEADYIDYEEVDD